MSTTLSPSAEIAETGEEPPSRPAPHQSRWTWILCVVGLDYMSTLGYLPSIASDTSGRLAPIVIGVLGLVTVFGALPLYWYVAGRSPHGGGAAALLERLIPGWLGKLLILVTLGFAATDLIFTRTFSSADAAEHLLHSPNPSWRAASETLQGWIEGQKGQLPEWATKPIHGMSIEQLTVTIVLLLFGTLIGAIFRHGFRRRFLQLAVLTALGYLILNLFVIGGGVKYLVDHPKFLDDWWRQILSGDWNCRLLNPPTEPGTGSLLLAGAEPFPRVALGLSGFEIAMLLMPLVRGWKTDTRENPHGRIWNTRKMLVAAAVTMPLYLFGASLVTTLLIPPEAMQAGGAASNRALSYLAHGGPLTVGDATLVVPIFGLDFGTLYDVFTILILCLSGVSVGLCLADLLPPYLIRLGMELNWMHRLGLMVYLLTGLKIGVTIYFGANVDAQRSAYSTSVLAIFAIASFTAALDIWRQRSRYNWWIRFPYLMTFLTAAFTLSLVHTVRLEPSGLFLTLWIIGFILITSMLTRFYRAAELRVCTFEFADANSKEAFEALKRTDFPILVPHRPGHRSLVSRELEVRRTHRIRGDIPVVFVVAELGDPSEFALLPLLEVKHESGRVLIEVTRCANIASVLAAIAIEMSREGVAPEIHFGWSEENPLTANIHFVLFGQGNVPWMVHTLLKHSTLPESRKPRVLVG